MVRNITKVNKFILAMVIGVLMITLTSCGKESISLKMESEGLKAEIKLTADGDEIISWEQEMEMDLLLVPSSTDIDGLIEEARKKETEVNAIEGCSYKITKGEDDVKELVKLEINKDNLSQLIELGMINISSKVETPKYLSYKETVENLKELGFKEDK